MSKIREILDTELAKGSRLGEVLVIDSFDAREGNTNYFVPYFETKTAAGMEIWRGTDASGNDLYVGANGDNWQLYTPPKRKVKKWFCIREPEIGGLDNWSFLTIYDGETPPKGYCLTNCYYEIEENMHKNGAYDVIKTNICIEVEEDEA